MKSRSIQLEIACQGYKNELSRNKAIIGKLKSDFSSLKSKLDQKSEAIGKIGKAHKQYNEQRDRLMSRVQKSYVEDLLALEEQLYQKKRNENHTVSYNASFKVEQERAMKILSSLRNMRRLAEGDLSADEEGVKGIALRLKERVDNLSVQLDDAQRKAAMYKEKIARERESKKELIDQFDYKLKQAQAAQEQAVQKLKEDHAEDKKLVEAAREDAQLAFQSRMEDLKIELEAKVEDAKDEARMLRDEIQELRTKNDQLRAGGATGAGAEGVVEELAQLRENNARLQKQVQELKEQLNKRPPAVSPIVAEDLNSSAIPSSPNRAESPLSAAGVSPGAKPINLAEGTDGAAGMAPDRNADARLEGGRQSGDERKGAPRGSAFGDRGRDGKGKTMSSREDQVPETQRDRSPTDRNGPGGVTGSTGSKLEQPDAAAAEARATAAALIGMGHFGGQSGARDRGGRYSPTNGTGNRSPQRRSTLSIVNLDRDIRQSELPVHSSENTSRFAYNVEKFVSGGGEKNAAQPRTAWRGALGPRAGSPITVRPGESIHVARARAMLQANRSYHLSARPRPPSVIVPAAVPKQPNATLNVVTPGLFKPGARGGDPEFAPVTKDPITAWTRKPRDGQVVAGQEEAPNEGPESTEKARLGRIRELESMLLQFQQSYEALQSMVVAKETEIKKRMRIAEAKDAELAEVRTANSLRIRDLEDQLRSVTGTGPTAFNNSDSASRQQGIKVVLRPQSAGATRDRSKRGVSRITIPAPQAKKWATSSGSRLARKTRPSIAQLRPATARRSRDQRRQTRSKIRPLTSREQSKRIRSQSRQAFEGKVRSPTSSASLANFIMS